MKASIATFFSKNYPTFNTTGYYYQLIQNRQLIKTKHRHDFFELFVVIKGASVHICNEQRNAIQELDLVFLSPECAHCFEAQSPDLYVFSLSILPERFARFLSAFEYAPTYGKVYKIKNRNIINDILCVPRAFGQTQILLLNSLVSNLFLEIMKDRTLESEATPPFLQFAIQKFRTPEHIGLGVEKLAELAGVSRMHLGRLLKKYYGKTPLAFIQDIRMHLAAEYLKKTSYTLNVISENVGFSSLSRFHATFKQYFHCTPNAYRKQNHVDENYI